MIATDWPSWIQAISAGAIVFLTFVLVKATNRYVRETKNLAEEARRTNDAAQASTDRLIRATAPRIVVSLHGKADNPPPFIPADVRFIFFIRNAGATAAHDIALDVDGEHVRVTEPLEAGETAVVFQEGDAPAQPPNVRSVVFRDPAGTRWKQVGQHFELPQIPELVSDDELGP
jgi:hypothetical protein